MDKTFFIIIFSSIIGIHLLLLILHFHLQPVVKAGKANKFHWRYRLVGGERPKTIVCNGEQIDVSSLEVQSVYGNSMKDFLIKNGQQVLVSPYNTEEQKKSINSFPVLVFHITDRNRFDSKYKLRKFLCYVTNIENTAWEEIFTQYKDRIKVSKDSFIDNCIKKSSKEAADKSSMYILSETFNEYDNKYEYSLHPISTLYASVKYVI